MYKRCVKVCNFEYRKFEFKSIDFMFMEKEDIAELLKQLADKYETEEFINGDPSWFMHQVKGRENQETMGFLASVLSYGKRDLFLPKIQFMLDSSKEEPYEWVLQGDYKKDIPDNTNCYYRLYNNHMMVGMLDALHEMLASYGSMGEFVKEKSEHHLSLEALNAIGGWFLERGIKGMVPSPKTSVAKRPVMFMRWMVRDSSPVDLGLWSDFIDKRSLYIPMDTHVLQEAQKLGLVKSKSASWHTVEQLTDSLKVVFPDDPAKGDFALFGYGVNQG